MPAPRRPGRARVVFDELLWGEDMARATAAGAEAATEARRRLERDGAPIEQLRACQAEGRDGARLGGCLKIYVPPPAGPWGIVFRLAVDEDGSFLAVLAFASRHPTTGRHTSVYQLADERLHRPGR